MPQAYDPEDRVYTIFLKNNPPCRIVSKIDVCKEVLEQIASRAKKGDWWRPLELVDESGEKMLIWAESFVCVVQGAPLSATTEGNKK